MLTLVDTIQIISTVLLAGALIFAAIQTRIAAHQTELLRTQIRDEFEWRRREKALNFSQIYVEPMRNAKNRIVEAFGEYIQDRVDPLSNKEIYQAIEDEKITQNEMDYFLSYLETMGISVKHEIASFDVVYELIAHTYVQYYFVFIPYIYEQRKHNQKLWINVEGLADKLIKEMESRNEMPVHFGNRKAFIESTSYKLGNV